MSDATSPLHAKEKVVEAVEVSATDGFIHRHGFEEFKAISTDDYKVVGEDMQVLNIKMSAGETRMTEPGTFFMSTEDVELTTSCDDCCAKWCTGENPITTRLENTGSEEGYIGLTANYPAQIVPVSLEEGGITAAKGAYMCSDKTVETSCDIDWNPLTACFSGLGCMRQGLAGGGTVFLNAGGSVLKKTLKDGETMVVDTEGIVAWANGVSLGVQSTGGCIMCCFSGEGCCNTTLTGPGDVYIASMPLMKLKRSLGTSVTVPKKNGAGGAPSSGEIER